MFGQNAEKAFDLVQPGRARWGVVEVDARVGGEPGAHVLRIVRRRVVENDMELPARIGADDLLHKPEEVRRRMAGTETVGQLPVATSRAAKRSTPVPPIRACAARRGQPVRGAAVALQGLGRLLDTEHNRVRYRPTTSVTLAANAGLTEVRVNAVGSQHRRHSRLSDRLSPPTAQPAGATERVADCLDGLSGTAWFRTVQPVNALPRKSSSDPRYRLRRGRAGDTSTPASPAALRIHVRGAGRASSVVLSF